MRALCLSLIVSVNACHKPAPECVCPPPPPVVAAAVAPEPMHVARRPRAFSLHVSDDEANEDKRVRCRERVHTLGAHLDDDSPVKVSLVLSERNRLEIRSASRGVVLREPLGRDPIFDLCTELTSQALAALAREPRDG